MSQLKIIQSNANQQGIFIHDVPVSTVFRVDGLSTLFMRIAGPRIGGPFPYEHDTVAVLNLHNAHVQYIQRDKRVVQVAEAVLMVDG